MDWSSPVSRKRHGHMHEAKGLGLSIRIFASSENQASLPSPFVTSAALLSIALHFITCQLLKICQAQGRKDFFNEFVLWLAMFLLMI